MRTVQAVGVVHTLVPTHPEWAARLNRAAKALRVGEVDVVIVTGGRYFRDGEEVYNNPRLMRTYLIEHGVPSGSIVWRDIPDSEVETAANPVDAGDEVGVALSLIADNGWCSAIIRPISNQVHLLRLLAIYRARAGVSEMRFGPLPIPSMLGRKWKLMEVLLFRPYTLLDPGWRGPLAEWMRKRRRSGSGFGIAGGSSGKNA